MVVDVLLEYNEVDLDVDLMEDIGLNASAAGDSSAGTASKRLKIFMMLSMSVCIGCRILVPGSIMC